MARLGQTVDFLLTTRRDEEVKRRSFAQVINVHDAREEVIINERMAKAAAARSLMVDTGLDVEPHQPKYLNKLGRQDPSAIKRQVRPMIGFRRSHAASTLIARIETMHAIRKGRLGCQQALVVPPRTGSTVRRLVERPLSARRLAPTSLTRHDPTMFHRILKLEPTKRMAHSVKTMTHAAHGAVPCPTHVKHATIDWWGLVLYAAYSEEECIGGTIIGSQVWPAHPGSVRRPRDCAMQSLDDDGEELAASQVGTVYFESRASFSYWHDPEKARSVTGPQGWRTFCDVGYVDSEGYL